MNTSKWIGVLLIAAGALGLLYGGFSYTRQTQELKLGPIELSVEKRHTVNIPVWAGAAAIVAGGLLLAFGGRSRP